MGQFRYRTSALTGSWRSRREQAVQDAVRAGQILPDAEESEGFRWVVPGKIEEKDEAPSSQRRHA